MRCQNINLVTLIVLLKTQKHSNNISQSKIPVPVHFSEKQVIADLSCRKKAIVVALQQARLGVGGHLPTTLRLGNLLSAIPNGTPSLLVALLTFPLMHRVKQRS